MPPITHFHGDHFFLSNFYPIALTVEGDVYPTLEHAYQALKTFDPAERQTVREAGSPSKAKRLGRRVTLRADWEKIKFDLMRDLLRQKFAHPDLRQLLLDTGAAELIEGNTWGDRVWGCTVSAGQWIGQNHLGKLLMEVRDEILASTPPTPSGLPPPASPPPLLHSPDSQYE
jgi:hypothetical protein